MKDALQRNMVLAQSIETAKDALARLGKIERAVGSRVMNGMPK
jgi:hypothetical protein